MSLEGAYSLGALVFLGLAFALARSDNRIVGIATGVALGVLVTILVCTLVLTVGGVAWNFVMGNTR